MTTVYWCHLCQEETNVVYNAESNLMICLTCRQDFIEERNVQPTIHIDPIALIAMIQQFTETAELNEALNESMNTDQPTKIPASNEFIDNLSPIIIGDKDITEKCSICLDNFKRGIKGCKLPCGHLFHEECIKDWLKVDHICPVCRTEFDKKEDS